MQCIGVILLLVAIVLVEYGEDTEGTELKIESLNYTT
jgi:hypothetical protein